MGTPAGIAITADGSALALAALVWSRQYARLYLPLARLLMPVSAAAVAVLVAHRIVEGQGEQLAILTINILASSSTRAAVSCDVGHERGHLRRLLVPCWRRRATQATLLPCLAIVLMTLLLCIVGYRDIEIPHRRSFLETALIAELVARDELSGLSNRPAFDEHWHTCGIRRSSSGARSRC